MIIYDYIVTFMILFVHIYADLCSYRCCMYCLVVGDMAHLDVAFR